MRVPSPSLSLSLFLSLSLSFSPNVSKIRREWITALPHPAPDSRAEGNQRSRSARRAAMRISINPRGGFLASFLSRGKITGVKSVARRITTPSARASAECPPRSDKFPSRPATPTRPPADSSLAPCNCSLVRDIKRVAHRGAAGRDGVIDDGKGASEGRLASSIPLRGSESATVCSDTHKHEGWTLPHPRGEHFHRHAHGHASIPTRGGKIARSGAVERSCPPIDRWTNIANARKSVASVA